MGQLAVDLAGAPIRCLQSPTVYHRVIAQESSLSLLPILMKCFHYINDVTLAAGFPPTAPLGEPLLTPM